MIFSRSQNRTKWGTPVQCTVYIILLFVFKGRPNTSAKPCPGEEALKSDVTCPVFKCSTNDCKNAGTCESDGSCTCKNEFAGIDCTLGKFINHNISTPIPSASQSYTSQVL